MAQGNSKFPASWGLSDAGAQAPMTWPSADAVAAQQTTVSGTRPADGEPRELHVGEDGLRRGRAVAA